MFVVNTALTDNTLIQHIQVQNAAYSALISQLGYRIPRGGLATALFLPLGGLWRIVTVTLRVGWYAVFAGGGALLVSGLRPLAAQVQRSWTRSAALLAAAALIAGLSLGRTFVANLEINGGIVASTRGDYAAALDAFDAALRLNPSLKDSARFDQYLGSAQLAVGDNPSPWSKLAQGRLQQRAGQYEAEAEILADALARDPNSIVLRDALIRVDRYLAVTRSELGALSEVVTRPWADQPANHYLLGRAIFKAGDFSAAKRQFEIVMRETPDTEIQSSALTYIGLCLRGLGDYPGYRSDLLRAIQLDTGYYNQLARSLAFGQYVTQ
jgi:tetratricopeptide (TPR) repeat protein